MEEDGNDEQFNSICHTERMMEKMETYFYQNKVRLQVVKY